MIIAVLFLIVSVLGLLLFNSIRAKTALKSKLTALQSELSKFQPITEIQSELSRLGKERVAAQAAIKDLKAQLDIERAVAQASIDDRRARLEQEKDIVMNSIKDARARLESEKTHAQSAIDEAKARLSKFEIDLDFHELGFYQPKFQFDDVLKYKEALELVREAQKELIRQKQVFETIGNMQPLKELRDLSKLAVSAFNGEASAIIESVRYDNFEKCRTQIQTNFEKVNSLIMGTGLQVSKKYFELKIKELALVYDFKEVEQKTKTEQAELKAAMREEEEARSEAEEARERAIKEQERFEAALQQVREEMATRSDDERLKYEAKILEIQSKLDAATVERERATSMAQITKKGHVYIVSNIGSFGEQVLKIGMTRRKDPAERIKELGDASVPFGFDIHALIETEDAPALESRLHSFFDDRRKNKVNPRKEFFDVSIDEIASVCENFGLNIRLTKFAEAREYRETQKMTEHKNAA